MKLTSFKVMNFSRRLILKSPKLTYFVKLTFARYPHLRLFAKKLIGIEGDRMNINCFDDLTSVKIMNSMSISQKNENNHDSVVFLKIDP